jgi:hypothetical protein
VTVGRCGVMTTLTSAPFDGGREVSDLDDARAKKFFALLDALQAVIYAADWPTAPPTTKP